jgi:antitoxin PrlF
MATATKRKAKSRVENASGAVYRGKLTRTGNSSGLRFEGALFKSHPEFKGEVRAHVIAPGRMLVTAEPHVYEREDPVLAAFLAFLAQDMKENPQSIRPLDPELFAKIDRLTRGVRTSPDEDLGDEPLI